MKDLPLKIYALFLCLVPVIIIGSIIAYILALIIYGNTPVTEMPVWAWLFLR